MALIRSISGLRGTLGDGLTPVSVTRYVEAFAQHVGGGPIVVGRDGRPSGEWIEAIVAGTLQACGVDVWLLGVVPTPTVQLITEKTGAAGGISISASHNPSEWNGLKFLNSDGIFLDREECVAFFAIADKGVREFAPWDAAGHRQFIPGAAERHIEAALSLPFVTLDALRERRFKVVVDAVNASGSEIVPVMLEACGCEVVRLHCDGTGLFPHAPEPLPENLGDLCQAVAEHKADFGVAVDPDADRLVLIDERGEPFGEEYTITQAVEFVLAWERERDILSNLRVVVNLSTTRAVEDVAERYGATVVRTPVGEINVARKMKEIGALIGGEGSGGVILAASHYGRDSLVGLAITLQHLLKRGGTLSELRASLPSYEIVKKKATLPPKVKALPILKKILKDHSEGSTFNGEDGLKLDFEGSWVHMRASNTEPIIRVIAEARTTDEADDLARRYLKITERLASKAAA